MSLDKSEQSHMGLSLALTCFHLFYVFSCHHGSNEGLYKFFVVHKCFESEVLGAAIDGEVHADILIKSECVLLFLSFFFYSFGELTRVFGAALYGRISLLKCDKERL